MGEGWGKTLDIVLRVPPCYPHFPPQGESSKDQICATLLIKMKVFNGYEASPTGGKWGKRSKISGVTPGGARGL